jgi:peptidoglycan L-alanyl-D-glutamate endopeptidase CwlK
MSRYKWAIIGTLVIGIGLYALRKELRALMGDTWDYWTNRRIEDLHPSIRDRARGFINTVQDRLGIKLRLTDGLHTWEEQANLYAKGRTKSGSIVTYARAGESYHNYGLAFDVVPIQDGQPQYDTDRWQDIADIAISEYGFQWGGNFSSLDDKPHFYDPAGYSVDQLAERYERGVKNSEGFVKLA